ncbi:cytochrome c oxidase subunit 6a, mitochondrial-like isoform X1 [Olea europaea var. sylvestris]|uniref:cytochrome c oxidase subunit 6a, mitochondrial-like isoform X1 n=1 Tax=Olea europaea var. sylvestris TaxID=158386 RepID=UPI000C1D09D0|nr:cytochrome c oxidase subunit 6a, mitochondrial-like isoform X1 [Olea europaea var. sylvestris]
MASAIVRSGLRSAIRSGASVPRASPASKRTFASHGHHDEAAEAAKWEKITYLGIATCTILAVVNLSKGHPHHEEPPPYPYLHIRNKEFPWDFVVSDIVCQPSKFSICFYPMAARVANVQRIPCLNSGA